MVKEHFFKYLLLKRQVGKTLQTNGAKTFILGITCLNDKEEKTLPVNVVKSF
jgi:hypothetical protein